MGTVRIAAGPLTRASDGRRPPLHAWGRRAARPGRRGSSRREPLVLDLVFVVTVVALFALVSAVAAGVEKL